MLARIFWHWLELNSDLGKSFASLQRLQELRLKRIIAECFRIPYYKKKWNKAGLSETSVSTLDGLKKLPFLEKREIQASGESILNPRFPKNTLRKSRTTGSTGFPLSIYADSRAVAEWGATMLFALTQSGCGPLDRRCYITRDLDTKQHILQRLGLFQPFRISVFNTPEETAQKLGRIRPAFLEGYPSVASLVAQELLAKGTSLPLRKFLSHGETLPPRVRHLVKRAFGAESFNFYGSAEFPRLGWECEAHEGIHTIPRAAIIEIVDKGGEPVGEGEKGEIVVSGLVNSAMPLIRYRLGDVGVWTDERCSCGRPFPLIKSIEGRKDDFIILPNGKKVSPRSANFIDDVEGIREYSILQTSKTTIAVSYVPAERASAVIERSIVRQIRLGVRDRSVKIAVRAVKSIPRGPTGKLAKVRSLVR